MPSAREIGALYDAEYFAKRCSSIPYERSAHWANFFAIIADQVIRALHPQRVLDAGCAMGLLVEAFWDRGVYCEGIDISEYAISQVRPDIREYCRVGSLVDAIPGQFDLVTCIEVLEHLSPEEVKAAVRNLCSTSGAVLFSSTPDGFDEPAHVNVRPAIYWLRLFSEFDFWPDVRFDAGFITPYAVLFRKGRPPEDDLLPLFSDFIRYKSALQARTAALQQLQARLKEQVNARSAPDRSSEWATALEREFARLHKAHHQFTSRLQAKDAEIQDAEQKLIALGAERDRLLARIELSEGKLDRSEARIETLQPDRDRFAAEVEMLKPERDRLAQELEESSREAAELRTTLAAVLNSKAWRLAERCRIPVRKLRQDWPALYRIVRFFARKFLTSSEHQAAHTQIGAFAQQEPNPESGSAAQISVGEAEAATPIADQQLVNEESSPPATTDENVPPPRSAAPECGRSADAAYQTWIDQQEPTTHELHSQRELAHLLPDPPLFSVIIPVYVVDHTVLQDCVQSVLRQTYARWEMCIACAPDGDSRNLDWLRNLASSDGRVRLRELERNGGISRNSNAALDLATGEFIVLLDHDDSLAPFALFEMASRLQEQPDADILYSDHDYLDAGQGLRCTPLFKPEWSPEIMLSANYLTHLTVLRRDLIEQAGRFDSSTDGAQDWDLFLRAVERTSRIAHIPKVLYHWRMHPESTARNGSAKNYAADAQLLAIGRHMDRIGMDADPEVMPDGLLHVRFRRAPEALVSIVIPTKDRVDLLSRCISTLLEHTRYQNFEILIMDNASSQPETREYLRSLSANPRIRIIWYPGAFNYSAVNNTAVREALGDFLLFLNNDVEITRPDWLDELVAWANFKPVGVVGAQLLRLNGALQHAGIVLGMNGFADHPFADQAALTFGMAGSTGWYRNFLAVTGACMMMRREVFDSLGGFDENFILCGSDVEICLRAHRQGYRIVYNPFAQLVHHEQQTRGADIPAGDYIHSFKHYGRWLLNGDPFWSPNVSLWSREPKYRYREEASSYDFAARHVAAVKETAPAPTAETHALNEEESIVADFDCSQEQLRYLREHASLISGFRQVKRIIWFVPSFENAFFGGVFTFLRFADYWGRQKGVQSLFAICNHADQRTMAARIRLVYPGLQDSDVFVMQRAEDFADLPLADASICTLWTTAYFALHHKAVARRFYLIQDFEPAFYRAGSASAIVESTYRMGLYGIANTSSIRRIYETEYGGKAIHFNPFINEAVFYPSEFRDRRNPEGPWLVFFYGRPVHRRNSFELLSAAMKRLKQSLRNRVRIVSAGGEWEPSEYGLQGIVENLGNLSYEDCARLYRETDVGVVMMLTRHPSYVPLELMACGSLVVTNLNAWTSWLLEDGENCLLTCATATAIAETVERGLLDTALRQRITSNALARIRSNYLNGASQMEEVYSFLCDPEACLAANRASRDSHSLDEQRVFAATM